MRLDRALVDRGLAVSRTAAAALIAEGRVELNGSVAAKAGQKTSDSDSIGVRPGQTPDFVSRAGQKLYGALRAVGDLDVRGLRCLDAGASTGGFTDVLLREGAERVVAVDVGHGQLVPSLREDARVEVFEGLNVRFMEPEEIGGPADLTVADLSFISLTLVLEPLVRATAEGGVLLLMVKPQFEVGRERIGAGGVVREPSERKRAVRAVLEKAESLGLELRTVSRSALPGQDGNLEYFAEWARPAAPGRAGRRPARKIGVDEALSQLEGSGAFES